MYFASPKAVCTTSTSAMGRGKGGLAQPVPRRLLKRIKRSWAGRGEAVHTTATLLIVARAAHAQRAAGPCGSRWCRVFERAAPTWHAGCATNSRHYQPSVSSRTAYTSSSVSRLNYQPSAISHQPTSHQSTAQLPRHHQSGKSLWPPTTCLPSSHHQSSAYQPSAISHHPTSH